jgi:hypothetical protein
VGSEIGPTALEVGEDGVQGCERVGFRAREVGNFQDVAGQGAQGKIVGVMAGLTHPGGALDSLTPPRPPVHLRTTGERLRGLPAGIFLQGKEAAAWSAVRAVLDPSVRGGQM